MAGPRRLNVIDSVLYVTDYNNNRITTFDLSSLASGMAAQHVIGQPSFTQSQHQDVLGNYSGAFYKPLAVRGIQSPFGMAMTQDYYLIADYGNSRVLIIGK